MASVVERSSKFNYLRKKMENCSTSVEGKCQNVYSSLQELKQTCAQAIGNVNQETRARNSNSENLKYERDWKLKVIHWEDSKRRDMKVLEDELQFLKERVDKHHPYPMPKQVYNTLYNRYVRQGFAMAVAGIFGITATAAAFF